MAGLAAWLVGATAATGISVLAVSLLGEDAGSAQGSPLSQAEVSRALVAMAATPSDAQAGPSASRSAPGTSATPTTGAPTAPRSVGSPTGPSSPTPSGPASQVPPETTDTEHSSQRHLSNAGGDVVAQCQGGLAYLVSWSPAQDFQVGRTQRGPSHVASVVFADATHAWPLRVACFNGVPTKVSGDDDVYDH